MLAVVWSCVVLLQVRAILDWAFAVADASGDGGGALTLVAVVTAGSVVVAVVGGQRASAGPADIGRGSLRFLSGVAWVVLALVLLYAAWSAIWVVGDPSAMPELLFVAAATAPPLAVQAVLRRLRTVPPGTGGPTRVAVGLVAVSLVPFLLAGMLVVGAAAATG
ncbi:hypothetical protein [Cellulomonas chitinilytica]|uniref:hypothetical protein n=1 Tax=Cellulomonas chitinilytica TaxID=398759 RepID=UPI001942B7F6|nr:hypothetical protein [Cellulomonas chitinilytica]